MIRKGTYLYVTTNGSSSDEHRVEAICRANRDLDMEALRAEYLSTNPEEGKVYGFLFWLVVDKQAIAELISKELYLGGNGRLVSAKEMLRR